MSKRGRKRISVMNDFNISFPVLTTDMCGTYVWARLPGLPAGVRWPALIVEAMELTMKVHVRSDDAE
jgi:hypothetical protein